MTHLTLEEAKKITDEDIKKNAKKFSKKVIEMQKEQNISFNDTQYV